MAHTFMVKISLHWTEIGTDDLSLWSFAEKHSAWLYNQLPNKDPVLTQSKTFTRSKSDNHDLLRCHIYGFPGFFKRTKAT